MVWRSCAKSAGEGDGMRLFKVPSKLFQGSVTHQATALHPCQHMLSSPCQHLVTRDCDMSLQRYTSCTRALHATARAWLWELYCRV